MVQRAIQPKSRGHCKTVAPQLLSSWSHNLPAGEAWLEWHRRTLRAASIRVAARWGADAVTAVVSCAVGAVARLAARSRQARNPLEMR